MSHMTKHSIDDLTLEEAKEALAWLQERIQHVKFGSEAEWNIICYNADVCARIKHLEGQ
jgi:hypothetical protein